MNAATAGPDAGLPLGAIVQSSPPAYWKERASRPAERRPNPYLLPRAPSTPGRGPRVMPISIFGTMQVRLRDKFGNTALDFALCSQELAGTPALEELKNASR